MKLIVQAQNVHLHLILSFNLPDMLPSLEGILKQDLLGKWMLMRWPQGSHYNLSITPPPPYVHQTGSYTKTY